MVVNSLKFKEVLAYYVKKINEQNIERIKEKGLFLIDGIEEDFKSIVNISVKKKTNKKNDKKSVMAQIFEEFPLLSSADDDYLENLILSRKDRKYAALTIELASTMESFLRELYESIEGKPFKKQNEDEITIKHKKQKAISTIQALEYKLENRITIGDKGSLDFLNNVRNKVVHGHFSLKESKKHRSVQQASKEKYGDKKVKSQKYISDFISFSRDYIRNVTV